MSAFLVLVLCIVMWFPCHSFIHPLAPSGFSCSPSACRTSLSWQFLQKSSMAESQGRGTGRSPRSSSSWAPFSAFLKRLNFCSVLEGSLTPRWMCPIRVSLGASQNHDDFLTLCSTYDSILPPQLCRALPRKSSASPLCSVCPPSTEVPNPKLLPTFSYALRGPNFQDERTSCPFPVP